MAKMKGGKVEIICSGCRDQSPDIQVQQKEERGGIQKKKKVAIQKKPKTICQSKEECQPMEEDQPAAEVKPTPAKVDKHVKQLKKDQLAQRDVIDKMQILIQDLVKVLKESHIHQPAPSQQSATEPKGTNNEPMEAEAILEAGEEEEVIPQINDQEEEGENNPESEEVEGGQADVQETEEEAEEPVPVDPRAEKRKKRKEQKAALKLRMNEKMRAMKRKAKSRAMKKRAAAADAKEATENAEAKLSIPVQDDPVKIKKRKNRKAPPKDKSLHFKRRR